MKTTTKADEIAILDTAKQFAASGTVRCQRDHSGNHCLTYDQGYFQCNGCGHFHTPESVYARATIEP